MLRGASLSRLLAAALIPLFCWGLLATLMLHLIEVRSAFIAGGEGRLRQAVLAFAFAIVLVQRLSHVQGRSHARAYAYAVGGAMLLFTIYHAGKFGVPGVHPIFVFLVNAVLFTVLWWAGNAITEACSVDSVFDAANAADTGILYRTSRQWRDLEAEMKAPKSAAAQEEDHWTERLPGRHPGRVIFFFSLVAVPIFAVGVLAFDETRLFARVRAGVFLFVYLVCAFGLLALAHLRQLAVYYAKRDISLPEAIGVTWLAVAGVVTVAVLCVAVFLPQPPSLSGYFVRQRIVAASGGWSVRGGGKGGTAGKPGQTGSGGGEAGTQPGAAGGNGAGRGNAPGGETGGAPPTAGEVGQEWNSRYRDVDRIGDKTLSDYARNTGMEPEARNLVALSWAVNDTIRAVFDWLLKGIFLALILCSPVLLYILATSGWRALFTNRPGKRSLRNLFRLPSGEKKKRKPKDFWKPDRPRFRRFESPFAPGLGDRDGDTLVRLCWEAVLAFCEDFGTPCPPEATPLEFVGGHPGALRGFEDHAHFIANLYTFSEFSGQSVAESTKPMLRQFWSHLERHVAAAAQ